MLAVKHKNTVVWNELKKKHNLGKHYFYNK